ncbi:hypothetical protein SGB_02483 [Shigella boydii ATCC 9905]|nr:hypothetical protein SGB_02483 [Shigella boydii ATCC 9905]
MLCKQTVTIAQMIKGHSLVIRVEKLSKRAVTSRVKRGAAPFL